MGNSPPTASDQRPATCSSEGKEARARKKKNKPLLVDPWRKPARAAARAPSARCWRYVKNCKVALLSLFSPVCFAECA